jgi:hypothetical protein
VALDADQDRLVLMDAPLVPVRFRRARPCARPLVSTTKIRSSPVADFNRGAIWSLVGIGVAGLLMMLVARFRDRASLFSLAPVA